MKKLIVYRKYAFTWNNVSENWVFRAVETLEGKKKYPKKPFIAVPLDDSSLREIKQMRRDHEVYLEIKANTFNLFFFKWKAENKKKERNFKVLEDVLR